MHKLQLINSYLCNAYVVFMLQIFSQMNAVKMRKKNVVNFALTCR